MNLVFNELKKSGDYEKKQPLFFGPNPGLFDTIHKQYPKVWDLYKTMQSLDWSSDEFDYSICNLEFKNCPKSVADIMIRTLAWQWEADSVASRAIAPVLAPFITDSSLWAAWQRISDNEVIHAQTYSEIVRMSFDDPESVIKDILDVKESLIRMNTINEVFSKVYTRSHQYALGQCTVEEAYDDLFMAVVALYLLERIQFMASFAITFTICSSNLFQPIGKAVQKIAQDELEVHAELDKEVIRIELGTERGKETYNRLKPIIKILCDEVVQSELDWTDSLFSEGRELVGTNAGTVKQWVLFNAREVYKFLDIESEHKFPTKNPMPIVADWINISNTQSAPQEQDNNQYKLCVVKRDDSQTMFNVDF